MKVAQRKFTKRYHALMAEFPLYPIRKKAQADAATKILDKLFRERFEDEGEEAYVLILADLLADYEEEQDPFASKATGVDVLRHIAEESGIKQAELAKVLGVGQSAVSQILGGSKPITADHARRLGKHFKLNPGAFL